MTLEDAIKALSANKEPFDVLLEEITRRREETISELASAENPEDVMKVTGGIVTWHEIKDLLESASH